MIKRLKASRIRFSLLCLPAIFLIFCIPITKIMLYIFLILSLHEGAHILVAKLFHYPIKYVTIYPFGLSAQIPDIGYGSIVKEICIVVAGPLTHVFLPFLFRFFFVLGWISHDFCEYLYMMNASVLVFNLLPIYPLDGGRLLQALCHSIFRYHTAQVATCMVSFLVLSLVCVFQVMRGVSALVVECFLCIQIFLCYVDITHTQLQFYHYRYRHPVQYPLCMNEKKDLYRGRYNIMHVKSGYIGEEQWLHYHFVNQQKR